MESNINEIIQILKDDLNCDHEGWVHLGKLGKVVKNRNIEIEGDLLEFLFKSELIETRRIINNPHPPIWYARPAWTNLEKNLKLLEWAYFPDFYEVIEDLRIIALDEEWSFVNTSEIRRNIILIKYLKETFKKLLKEDKILKGRNFALFNTGLVSKEIKPIYLAFEPNSYNFTQKWIFKEFFMPEITRTSFLPDGIIDDLPEKPQYFIDESQIQFTNDDIRPKIDLENILKEVYRLPLHFFEELIGKSLSHEYNLFIAEDNEKAFFINLANSIRNDPSLRERFKTILNDALNKALLRLEWDPKTAVPIFYPYVEDICFVLPAQLTNSNKVDSAFLIQKKDNSCNVISILELSWAYTNARLINPVGSYWLNPLKIEMRE